MARKGENIFHRKDGRWEARYIASRSADGKAVYRSVYGATYLEAKQKRCEKLASVKLEKEPVLPNAGTTADICAEWIKENQYKWKEATFCRYQGILRLYILPAFGKFEFSDIRNEDVSRFMRKILTKGIGGREPVAPSTAKRILTVLGQLQEYATQKEYRVCFAAKNFAIREEPKKISVFTETEEKVLIDELKKEESLSDIGILLCLFTGIRIGELCALTWDEIDLVQNTLHIKKTMQRLPIPENGKKTSIRIDKPKSDCSIRTIPICRDFAKILRKHKKTNAYFLTGQSDCFIEPRTMENRFAKVLERCGLPNVKFHTTRHTFATRCIERGMDVKTLSEILGHANVSITMDRYVHPSMKHKAESVELISDLLAV